MITLTRQQIEALAKKGIKYEVPAVSTVTFSHKGTIEVHREFHTGDETNRNPLDITLDRLRIIPAADYAEPAGEVRYFPKTDADVDIRNDWTVGADGSLRNEARGYEISAQQLLNEKNWIIHMAEKPWVNMNSFIPAYLKALARLGRKTFEIQTSY